MALSSPLFLLYVLPAFLLANALTPRRARNALLAAASLAFYAWASPLFVPLILATITVDYLCGLVMTGQLGRRRGTEVPLLDGAAPRTRAQRAALLVSLATDLGLLAFFKYAAFATETLNGALGGLGLGGLTLELPFRVALPLGISFYTFKSMTYTIDVYRGHARGTRSLVDYASFVAAFPQLLAGPIWRWVDAAPQLATRASSLERAASGAVLLSFGLAKKVLLADQCGTVADLTFGAGSVPAGAAWLGALAFAMQIYFDFSGYSDMAIGVGRMLGFEFPLNFNVPYRAGSVTEFWRRWHITLSTWFRDYLFLPVAYSSGRRIDRLGLSSRSAELASYATGAMVTMLLCGLWHGAAWTFVLWGAFLGVAMVAERAVMRLRWYRRVPPWLKVAVTFVLLLLGWVLFRAPSLPSAGRYLAAMAGFGGASPLLSGLVATPASLLVLGVASAVALVGPPSQELASGLRPATALLSLALLLLSLAMLLQQTLRPFLYQVF